MCPSFGLTSYLCAVCGTAMACYLVSGGTALGQGTSSCTCFLEAKSEQYGRLIKSSLQLKLHSCRTNRCDCRFSQALSSSFGGCLCRPMRMQLASSNFLSAVFSDGLLAKVRLTMRRMLSWNHFACKFSLGALRHVHSPSLKHRETWNICRERILSN